MRRWQAIPFLALSLLVASCSYLPPLPANPFAVTPTVVAELPVSVATTPTQAVAPSPPSFVPFWVKNHRPTEMWSGQAGQVGVISFGTTSSQFCSFQVVEPQNGPRLYVLNPYSKNYFWIDADAVGPISEPPRRASGACARRRRDATARPRSGPGCRGGRRRRRRCGSGRRSPSGSRGPACGRRGRS